MRKSNLRASAALQALALMGAGVATAFIAAAPAAAQDYTNVSATGRVLGPDGAGVAGATVRITSPQGTVSTTTTDGSGAYQVPALQNGVYTFDVSAPGFESFRDSNVVLSQAGAGNNFQLVAAGAAGTTTATAQGGDVVVTGRRIRVSDFDRTTTGAVISVADIASRVPVARTLRDVILLAPGTTQGSSAANSAFSGQAQISGSSFTENAYYVNGLNITEFRQGFSPVTVPFDFYDTVEVKTGGFQAEFGRATGGVVNAITKSGSNTYHASVSAYFQPDKLSSDSPNTFSADNDGNYSQRTDTVLQASGPIIKDRLFIYGLYNFRDVESFGGGNAARVGGVLAPANNTGTRNVTRSPFWGTKIDAVPIDGQRLEFTFFDSSGKTRNDTYRYNSDTNVIGAQTGRTFSRFGGKNWVGRYTGRFTDFLTLSVARGRGNNRAGTLPNDLVNPRVIDSRSGTAVAVPGTNPANSVSTNDDVRNFIRGDVDLYFSLLGKHHFRFGYDREKLQAVQSVFPTGSGQYNIFTASASASERSGLPAGTQYFSNRFFQNGGAFHSKNEAFYAQDSWQLFDNRLTLNLGLRMDNFEALTADGQTFFSSKKNFGPRLGFSYDLFGNGSAKLFGSYGRTFVPPVSNTNIRLAGEELDYTRFFRFNGLDANGVPIAGAPVLTIQNARPCPDTGIANCNVNSLGGSGLVPSFVSRNAKSQYLDEFILGGEYRVPGSRWRFGAELMYRKLGIALEDAAVDQAAIAYCRSKGFSAAACNNLYSGFSQYVLINPGYDQDIILSSNGGAGLPDGTNPLVHFTAAQLGLPKARRTYKSATLKFDREFDGIWSLSGSYTWSSTKGNYEGGAKSDIGQTDTGITQDFDQPGFTLGAYGFLPGHRRHQFKLYGSYKVFDWLTLGANAYVASPKLFGCIGVVPPSVDPFANQYGVAGNFCQGKLVPRATALKSDWRKELNLSAAVRVPTDAFNASLRFDVFNVFNSKSALELREFGDLASGAPDPNYGKPVGFQAPRSARVGLVVGF